MIPLAPRYAPMILELADALDDPTLPMAETCRRVGAAAEGLGLIRPSYSHLRRFLVEKRAEDELAARRRAELRKLAADVYYDLSFRGRRVNPYDVAEQAREAGR